MRTHPALPLLGVALLAAACTAAPAPSTSQPAASGPVRSGHVAPTRSAEECRTLVEQVRAHPRNFDGTAPEISRVEVPDIVELARASGVAAIPVRLLVDETGSVVRDSIVLEPRVEAQSNSRDLKAALARCQFHPSVLEGCAVPAWTSLTYRVNN